MSAQQFENALEAPDNEASYRQFHALSSPQPLAGGSLAAAAAKYLRAFCDNQLSFLRRRWIGLCLKRMLDSTKVVQHFISSPQALAQLGQIILGDVELEEIKVLAAIVIRKGLEEGIAFPSFWPSEKVSNSAISVFPTETGPQWMGDFQAFMDTLDGLALAKTASDPVILYPIALVASDGFRWTDPHGTTSLLLIEDGSLKFIAPDGELQHIQFVDIPLRHVQNQRLRKSSLHDSQANHSTQHEPWDLTLQLQPDAGTWTYRANTILCAANDVTLIFAHKKDAEECGLAVMESAKLLILKSTKSANQTGSEDLPRIHQPPGAPKRNRILNTRRPTPSTSRSFGPKSRKAQIPDAKAVIQASGSRTDPTVLSSGESSNCSGGDERSVKLNPLASRTSLNIGRSPIRNALQTKPTPGALPKIKKSLKVTHPRKEVMAASINSCEHDEYEFPDDTPRMNRSLRSAKQLPIKVSKISSGTRSPAIRKLSAKSKPTGPKLNMSQRQQVNDTEDEDDSIILSMHSPMSAAPAHPLPSQREGKTNASQYRKLDSKPSGLTKVTKPRSSNVIREPPHPNVFEIPPDDESKRNTRTKRKSIKSVNYREPNDDSSGSDSVESKAVQRKSASGKLPVSPERRRRNETKSSPHKTRARHKSHKSKAVTPAISPKKISVAGKVLPKSNAPLETIATTTDSSTLVNPDRLANLRLDKRLLDEARLHPEVRILDRLNNETLDRPPSSGHGIRADGPGLQHDPVVPHVPNRKRLAESSPPSTPRAKRAKVTVKKYPDQSSSIGLQTSVAPLRVLKDPSSPCRQRKRSFVDQLKEDQSVGLSSHDGDLSKLDMSPVHPPHEDYDDSRRRLNWGQTPVQQRLQRAQPGTNPEILSSNSKPLPASPRAESRAISGHADRIRMDIEKELGEYETARSDPFKPRDFSHKITQFTRRLTGETEGTARPGRDLYHCDQSLLDASPVERLLFKIPAPGTRPVGAGSGSQTESLKAPRFQLPKSQWEVTEKTAQNHPIMPSEHTNLGAVQEATDTQPRTIVQYARDMAMEGDETLVADAEEPLPVLRATPIRFQSSPPLPRSDFRSSSSAVSEIISEPPTPALAAEEMEWEAGLKPHQRSLHDQLLDVSKRVLRHIVDNETAVSDIAETYARDGQHVLEMFQREHVGQAESILKVSEKNKQTVKAALEKFTRKLSKDREKFEDRSALQTQDKPAL